MQDAPVRPSTHCLRIVYNERNLYRLHAACLDLEGERMAQDPAEPMVEEVNLTSARNLSPLFDKAVRREHPVMIVRGGKERGLLVARDTLLRVLSGYRFHVDVLPEDEGGYTLWLKELKIGGFGATIKDARAQLLAAVRSYVRNFLDEFDFYRHLPEMVEQEPFVLRLSLAKDDAELVAMLFGPRVAADAAA